MTFEDELYTLGFTLVQSTRSGQRFAMRPNRFLQWWVNAYPDGTADFTWEFELGAYLQEKGFAVSVQDELSLMIFPRSDARGPAQGSWVSEQIAAAEAMLASVALGASG